MTIKEALKMVAVEAFGNSHIEKTPEGYLYSVIDISELNEIINRVADFAETGEKLN